MKNNKTTIWQQLNTLFGPGGIDKSRNIRKQKYYLGNDVLLRTTNIEDYEIEKLEKQQSNFLKYAWLKVEHETFQQSLTYEITRIGSYTNFESMEYFPEIAAALDIFMEESCTLSPEGKMLNIYSTSDRIKHILEDLFYNRLNIQGNLPMWTRNLCKYGDNFVFLILDENKGIIGCRQLPNFEIERREVDIFDGNRYLEGVDNVENETKFIWKGRNIEFFTWQIAHFRLLGDDRRLPYGTSLLEKARRIWKQCLLSEDAMLVYRITRAPERRIFKIFVGNIDDQDVQAYVNEIANRFKRRPVVDPQTGQIDLRYNMMANDQDFFIPVRDESAPSPIETLPGASNLNDIADIEFLQKKLCTALRVPKTFLGFQDPVGDGKNLALQDIRFSRTINRIQQAILMELNKIAIIHLYLLGFDDDMDNFILTMNNPSTQAEMLKIEHLQQKVTLYHDLVRDSGNGFAPMSMTNAKKIVFNWSDNQIKEDLLQQRLEKAAAAELSATAQVIKNTGIFDDIDNIYGDPNVDKENLQVDDKQNEGFSPENLGGGGGGLGSFGGDFGNLGGGGSDIDFGNDFNENPETPELNFGDENTKPNLEGGEGSEPSKENISFEDLGPLKESINKKLSLLYEDTKQKYINKQKKYSTIYFNKMIDYINKKSKPNDNNIFIEKNKIITENINELLNLLGNKKNDETNN